MIHKKTVPADGGYSIAVASEQMRDGKWLSVATITHSTETSQRSVDLPVPTERFDSEAEAERFAIESAKAWIEHNVPADEAVRG